MSASGAGRGTVTNCIEDCPICTSNDWTARSPSGNRQYRSVESSVLTATRVSIRRIMRKWLSVAAALTCLMLIAIGGLAARAAPVVDDRQLREANADQANWLMYGRTYDEQRFSPLQQINEATVSRLGLAWSRDLPTTRGVEATPIVVDGVMYTTSTWSVVYALNARTGDQVWTYDPKADRTRARTICCDSVNRGVAFYDGKVYVGVTDGRLIALNAADGKVVWTTQTTDPKQGYSITGAPRIANGLVLIGNGGAEHGVRGYVSAYDAKT